MKCIESNKINFGADRYNKIIKKSKIICVDFDNTVCLDEWPFIGPIIPGAIEVLNAPPLKEHIGEIIYDEYDGNAEIADAVTEKVTNKVIREYFYGEHWYITMPISASQCYYQMFYDIKGKIK